MHPGLHLISSAVWSPATLDPAHFSLSLLGNKQL